MPECRPKIASGGVVYCHPPAPETTSEDFYRKRSQATLAEYGRYQLETLVGNRVSRETNRLIEQRYSWRRDRPRLDDEARIVPQRYLQRWPWSFKIWTTASVFVPTHYQLSRLPRSQRAGSGYALGGLLMRITENEDLAWRPAQVATPADFDFEQQSASRPIIWSRHDAVRPLKSKFERTTVENLPDEVLAALWYRLHKTPLY